MANGSTPAVDDHTRFSAPPAADHGLSDCFTKVPDHAASWGGVPEDSIEVRAMSLSEFLGHEREQGVHVELDGDDACES